MKRHRKRFCQQEARMRDALSASTSTTAATEPGTNEVAYNVVVAVPSAIILVSIAEKTRLHKDRIS